MNEIEFISQVKTNLGIELTEKMLEHFRKYASFLREYNNHTNLTAINDLEDIYLKHFYDSLTITKCLDLNKVNNVCDVGTGAGFPGVVIKIVYNHINLTLIDSNNKKTKFLENLTKILELDNINIINCRSEEYAKVNHEQFDLVTARAVTTLPALIELCLPLVNINGYFIPLKGNVDDEIKASSNILKTLNGTLENQITFNLPKEDSKRTLLKIKKIGPTPSGYPRSYDKIKKSLKKNLK